MQLSVVLNTVYVMFVHFIIYNVKHNPPEVYKMYHRKWCFSITLGLQNANENEFCSFGHLALKSFGIDLEKFLMSLYEACVSDHST